MRKLSLNITLTAVALFLASCTQTQTSKEDKTDSVEVNVNNAKAEPSLKDEKVSKIYTSYNALKDALVASDAKEAQKTAAVVAKSLEGVKGCESSAVLANSIAASSDLKKQRADFTTLSSDLISFMKNADIGSGTIYVQYCPMANEGKGGYWMASNSEIRNPYYGDEMLNCGEVKEELKKK